MLTGLQNAPNSDQMTILLLIVPTLGYSRPMWPCCMLVHW